MKPHFASKASISRLWPLRKLAAEGGRPHFFSDGSAGSKGFSGPYRLRFFVLPTLSWLVNRA